MIEVKDLSVELRGFLLQDINFNVQDGEYFVLLGHTGAGKTVLLDSIAGLKPLLSGQIIINGRDVSFIGLEDRKIGFAYQDYTLYRHLSVRDNISFGLMWRKKKQKEIEKAIDQAIELLGLEPLLDKRPFSLSGGESQKIALARAFMGKGQIILLDEPASSLDPRAEHEIFNKFKELAEEKTALFISHRLSTVKMADRIFVMDKGRIIESGSYVELIRKKGSFAVLFDVED